LINFLTNSPRPRFLIYDTECVIVPVYIPLGVPDVGAEILKPPPATLNVIVVDAAYESTNGKIIVEAKIVLIKILLNLNIFMAEPLGLKRG